MLRRIPLGKMNNLRDLGGYPAADGHRHIPQRRVVQRLDRRVEIVHIDVQDDAVHSSSSPGNFIRNTCCEYLFVFL